MSPHGVGRTKWTPHTCRARLINGGCIWLCQILNHICKFEQIPDSFEHGIIIPAFKGKGRDPLLRKSYRGVTLTSVMAKVLKVALIQRTKPVLEDASIPQFTQTAYRKGVSCQNSIFAGTECNSTFVNGGDNVYTCFYNLDSAFDTVEFSVLLTELSKLAFREVLEAHLTQQSH